MVGDAEWAPDAGAYQPVEGVRAPPEAPAEIAYPFASAFFTRVGFWAVCFRFATFGFGGAALSFVNYVDELPFFCEKVIPLMREAGLRADTVDTP